jgi:hypothetical protein
MKASKHPDDFTRQIDKRRRDKPRSFGQNLSTDHVVLSRRHLIYHADHLSRPEELSWKQRSFFITRHDLHMNSFIDSF